MAPFLLLAFLSPASAAPSAGEAAFLDAVSPSSCAAFLREAARENRVAGTPADLREASLIAERFREFGLEVETADYKVLLSYPEEAEASIVSPKAEALSLLEGERLDGASGRPRLERLAWNAYSPSADVEAPVVYAGWGRPEDFALLDRLGVAVKGRVVLARYFKGYRAGKTLEAEKRGAAAILFYSDPADDGAAKGPVWPDGPWGPPDHFQRGADVYDFKVPGDPLTPGWASVEGAPRLPPEKASILPKVPSLPLSPREAEKIMKVLGGPEAPADWRGALASPYRLGPGPAVVRLHVRTRPQETLIRDVIGRLRGAEEPERLVILSNHHDAWTTGAVDPGLGTAAMLELARVFGERFRRGLRTRRTLVFASWDAEEYTLTGSTEWGEEHEAVLRKDAVACLNVDPYRWGRAFSALAVPSLAGLVRSAAADVLDPSTGRPIAAGWSGEVGALGSGSDYTVFLNRLGVPAVETTFEGPYGVYHSIYDTDAWVERFGDPGLLYTAAMARLWGLMALRLADARILPFDGAAYAGEVARYLEAVERDGRARRPGFTLSEPLAAARDWERTAAAFEREVTARLKDGSLTADQARAANGALLGLERALLDEDGLPGRPWFRHLIYAPRPSYAAETLPGLREAVEAEDFERAAEQSRRLAAALRRASALQKEILSGLEKKLL